MIYLVAIIMGIAGTALMTLFMYLMSYITKRSLKVVKILGTMITFQTTPEKGLSENPSAILAGIVAHYLIGIAFAYIFFFICLYTPMEPTFLKALVFGFLCGAFGITVWKIAFMIHPNPPLVPLKDYLVDLLLGHIIFGLGMWLAYVILTRDPWFHFVAV